MTHDEARRAWLVAREATVEARAQFKRAQSHLTNAMDAERALWVQMQDASRWGGAV